MGRVERRGASGDWDRSFLLLSLREKRLYLSKQHKRAAIGPGMAFKHKRLLRFPWNRVSTCLDVRPTPARRRGRRREERSVPAGIRGHCAGHLPVPFKLLYARAYADVPGEGTFGRRRAEPSRGERFHRNRLFEFVEKEKEKERKKERKKGRKNSSRLLFGRGRGSRAAR